MSFRAAIFDMDGVIINSEPLHVDAWRETAQKYGASISDEVMNSFRGHRVQEVARRLKEELFPAEFISISIEQLMQEKNQLLVSLSATRAELIPGVKAFLEAVRSSPLKIALATACDPEIQEIYFKRFELNKYFDVMITGGDISKGKPDPEVYLKALGKLFLSSNECFVIEDAVNGVKSAKAAKCYTIGITTTFPRAALLEAGADLVVDQFVELSSFTSYVPVRS